MHSLFIPVPEASQRWEITTEVCKALRGTGFYVWSFKVWRKQDGTITGLSPHVLFTDRPGDPDNATRSGSKADRTKAYRQIAKMLGLRGVYPRKIADPR